MAAKKVNGFVVLLGCFVGLVAVVLGAGYAAASHKLGTHVSVRPELLTAAPASPALVAEGRALTRAEGCTHCHADNLAGQFQAEFSPLGRIYSTNLTPGGPGRSVAAWALAVRHGLKADGTPLIGMPSAAYGDMSDEDLGAIIAYAASLPPVHAERPRPKVGVMGNLMVAVGMAPVAALDMRHDVPPIRLQPGVSVERGRYRSKLCTICHGSDFGGVPPGLGNWGPNLSRSGEPGTWSEDDFLRTIHTGVNPAGRKLNGVFMPWSMFREFSDEDLRSIWAYIRSLPASTRHVTVPIVPEKPEPAKTG